MPSLVSFVPPQTMPFDAKRGRMTFRRLDRELGRLTRKPAPECIHKFRTYSRRVEALLSDVVVEHHRGDEKLLKLLARLRKKAGRVRDLEVQIAALRDLKNAPGNGHKTQLLELLMEERIDREKKLAKAFDRKTTAELRRRLKRAAGRLSVPKNAEPVALTLQRLTQLSSNQAPLTERMLHQYRILGKRARYIAELANEDAAAKNVVDELKHMQDVLGDWHDWLKLTERAEELLGSVRDSAFVAMLRNVTQAKFRQSLDAVAEVREKFAGKRAPIRGPRAATAQTNQASAAVA